MSVCQCCGAKLVEYTHSFSKGLAQSLFLMSGRRDGVNISSIIKSHTMLSNFQKLRYWGLVERVNKDSEKGGDWRITELGQNFLDGKSVIFKKVTTYRANVRAFTGEQITFDKVSDGWLYRGDYKAQAAAQLEGEK